MNEKYRIEFLEMASKFIPKEYVNQLDYCLASMAKEYDYVKKSTELATIDDSNEKILKTYLASLKLQGRSEKTIQQYKDAITFMFNDINKNIRDIDTNDIRFHLANYQAQRKVSNITIENKRKFLSAFFTWLTIEEKIPKNPMLRIGKIKNKYVTKKPFSDEEVERLKDNTTDVEDRALLEFLLSTGCRVSEASSVNRDDIDYRTGECTVLGKGNKERTVYISDKAMYYIKEYVMNRTDNTLPLFLNARGGKLSTASIRYRLRKIGKIANVSNVHPHRCRRTFASDALNKGMAAPYIQSILGHSKLDTTMIYCSYDKDVIKAEYRKLM